MENIIGRRNLHNIDGGVGTGGFPSLVPFLSDLLVRMINRGL